MSAYPMFIDCEQPENERALAILTRQMSASEARRVSEKQRRQRDARRELEARRLHREANTL